eukprot:gene50-255_t
MVVVFIVGVLVTLAVLSVSGRGRSDQVELEARRIGELIRLAGERAIIYGEDYGLAVAQREYAFLVLTQQGWVPADGPLRQRQVPEPMQLSLSVSLDQENRFALPAPDRDEDDDEKSERLEPDVLFLSTGEMSPFEVTVALPGSDIQYRIKTELTGKGGFTLLEVLVAVAMVGIALAAVLVSTSATISNAGRFRDVTIGTLVARNVLIEFQVRDEWPDVGESDGDIEIGGRDWTWEALVSETPDENIRRIDVSTYAGERQAAALAGRIRGFTLLELMVAIAIFVIFSAMAYGGLMTVLNARADIEVSLEDTRTLQMALFRLEQDIEQIRARPIRDDFGDPRPSVILDETQRLEFTRGGRRNPMNRNVSSLERVGYGLEDERLVRYAWSRLDRVQDTQVTQTVMLDDVINLEWRFLDAQSEWQDQWPVPDPTTGAPALDGAPPQVIELRFETRRWGELRALYRITTAEAAT